jgi:hypothetical protein
MFAYVTNFYTKKYIIIKKTRIIRLSDQCYEILDYISDADGGSFSRDTELDHKVTAALSFETSHCRVEYTLKNSLDIGSHMPQEQRHDQNSLFPLDVARWIWTCYVPVIRLTSYSAVAICRNVPGCLVFSDEAKCLTSRTDCIFGCPSLVSPPT